MSPRFLHHWGPLTLFFQRMLLEVNSNRGGAQIGAYLIKILEINFGENPDYFYWNFLLHVRGDTIKCSVNRLTLWSLLVKLKKLKTDHDKNISILLDIVNIK